MTPPIIFLSYSHLDEADKNRLVRQMKVIERVDKIDLWSDERILPGGRWKGEIDKAMAQSELAILLITPSFLTSNFILDVEVPELLRRHKAAGLGIFPVLARYCAWELVPWLVELNVKPPNGKPIWRPGGNAEKELAQIVKDIAAVLQVRKRGAGGKTGDELTIPAIRSEARANVGEVTAVNVGEVTAVIDTDINSVRVAERYFDILTLDKIIHKAITYGVPLYNQKKAVECAEIYVHTVRRLVELIEESVYGPVILKIQKMSQPGGLPEAESPNEMDDRDVGVEVAYAALKEVSKVPTVTVKNASGVAWRVRHILDQLRFFASAIKEVEAALGAVGEPDEPFGPSVERVLRLAISQSDLIYEEGLLRDKRWINICAATYLHTARQLHSMLPMAELPGDEESSELADLLFGKVESITGETPFITEKTAFEIAWHTRHSFEHVLNSPALRKEETT